MRGPGSILTRGNILSLDCFMVRGIRGGYEGYKLGIFTDVLDFTLKLKTLTLHYRLQAKVKVFTRVCHSVHNRPHAYSVTAHPCWLLGHLLWCGRHASYWNAFLFN